MSAKAKYVQYREQYRQARLDGIGPSSFQKQHELSESAITSLYNWWKKRYPEEVEKIKEQNLKYLEYREEYRKTRLAKKSGWAYCKEKGLSKNAYNALEIWWKKHHTEEFEKFSKIPRTTKYDKYKEPYRQFRLNGGKRRDFLKKHNLSNYEYKVIHTWWRETYPDEAPEHGKKYEQYKEPYRQMMLTRGSVRGTVTEFLKENNLDSNAHRALYKWWSKNHIEESSNRARYKKYRNEYRNSRLKGETPYGLRKRLGFTQNELTSLYHWWKTNYPKEAKIITRPFKNHAAYHELYRQARLKGQRPVDFVNEYGLTGHDERALSGWWKNNFPEEYDEHVNRHTQSYTSKEFPTHVPVPDIPKELTEEEPEVEEEPQVEPIVEPKEEDPTEVEVIMLPPSPPKKVNRKGFFSKVKGFFKELFSFIFI